MNLGAFSISLSVKDLPTSERFYTALGFTAIGGEASQGWLILQNGASTIGLFQGMFEGNLLTFNPGWSNDGQHPDTFTDIREIQKRLKAAELPLTTEVDESASGPGSLTLVDPDGNVLLLDQHR